ncbi:MAG: hypothetical protein JNM89_05155 [Hyphomicrobiaceae bacterium]|nr:hypothetical protein [Hyphomicrobiaceae bacterium]
MHRFRKRNGRKLPAGLALAAMLVHVFFLSLHVAATAAHALGDGIERGPGVFSICGPARTLGAAMVPALSSDDGPQGVGSALTGLACPFCTSAASSPTVLPPACVATMAEIAPQASAVAPLAEPRIRPQHEFAANRSRAPPAAA